MNKILFIGQAPGSRAASDQQPLVSKNGSCRVARIAGLTTEAFLAKAEAVNIFPKWPGRASKGGHDAFDVEQATRLAAEMTIEGRHVVYLGRNVARAFGHPRAEFFATLADARATTAWCMPHPSGANRWWNDPVHREEARAFLQMVLRDSA